MPDTMTRRSYGRSANPQLHNGEPPVAKTYTSATMAPARAAQLIKGGSSAWIHTEFPVLRNFTWQDGYGAFTVSKSHVLDVIAYIQNQRQHHRGKTFKEEFFSLLERHEIDYDERYFWD